MTSAVLAASPDPIALVPGDPASVARAADAWRAQGDALHRTAASLARVDRADGWTGPAADGFRAALDAEPTRWREAGDSFHAAATALDRYRDVLTWAQERAAEAARLWQQGVDAATSAAAGTADAAGSSAEEASHALARAAQDMVDRAVEQLQAAGDEAARLVRQAQDLAPAVRRWPNEVAAATADVLDGVAGATAHVVDGAVDAAGSLGDAVLRGPATALGVGAAGVTAAVAGVSAIASAIGPGDPPVPSTGDAPPWDDPAVRSKIPAEFGEGVPNSKGEGHRWFDPGNKSRAGVRIDKGRSDVTLPYQQVDHVIVRDGGRVIGRDGKPIPGAIEDYPDAHIPLTEWKRWRTWNHP